MELSDTQIKIIEAAELEFAERGYRGASIREITRRAGVNVAAVNYHFGNKEVLFKEMVRYRLDPINRLRIDLLETALAENGGEPLPLERIVDFITRPLLTRLINESDNDFRFMRALGKSLSEERSFMRDLLRDMLKEIMTKFSQAISDSLGNPEFPKTVYGMHFLSCALGGAMMQHTRLQFISDGKINLNDIDELVDHLVAFLTAGLKGLARVPTKK